MQVFSSHGKLLLTGEYLVLDGGLALALPTSYGQELHVANHDQPILFWQSFDYNNNLWFQARLEITSIGTFSSLSVGHQEPVTQRLIELLNAASALQPEFAKSCAYKKVSTHLDFPNNWGLGTSSTLINNIAQWANVNPYTLLLKGFGGSGYDIACARSNGPIIYNNTRPSNPEVLEIKLDWPFKDELYFVHLNKKMDSKAGIAYYRDQPKASPKQFLYLKRLTNSFVNAPNISAFNTAIKAHERLIGGVLNKTPIQDVLFGDYTLGTIKSLGAWGGDFILATGNKNTPDYFKSKGFTTVIPFNQMILKNPKTD